MNRILSITLGTLLIANPVLAQQSPEQSDLASEGETLFRKNCASCHSVQPKNKAGLGPHLHKIYGRNAADAEKYKYSDAFMKLKHEGIVWDESTLHEFLKAPRQFAPGTTMRTFVHTDDAASAIIAYFKSLESE